MIYVENNFEKKLIRVTITGDDDGHEVVLDIDINRAIYLSGRLLEKISLMLELED